MKSLSCRITIVSLIQVILLLAPACELDGQDPLELPRIMDQNPKFQYVEPRVVYSPRLVPTWLKALTSNDLGLQRKAAESIAIARKKYVPGLDAARPILQQKISDAEVSRSVRVASAKALIALDGDKPGSEAIEGEMLKLLNEQNDPELHAICQQALIRWKSKTALTFWRESLSVSSGRISERVFACQGLAALNDKESTDTLRSIVLDKSINYRLRYAASKALGQLQIVGLESLATRFADSTSVADRLLAVALLEKHTDQASLNILHRLANEKNAAVCHLAWKAILGSPHPETLNDLTDFAAGHPGPLVRQRLIELMRTWKNRAAVPVLGKLLSDLHPDVRNHSRELLLEFAKDPDLRVAVLKQGELAIGTNWQGIQQGLLLLVALNHQPAAKPIVDLIEHRRAEVHVTACWALERLSVKETLEPVYRYTEEMVERIKSGTGQIPDSRFEAVAHLIMLLGKNRYRPMEKIIIRKLIPKDMSILQYPIRPAAIWSLGQIYQGQQLPEDYMNLLTDRLLDDNPLNPEHTYVKSMCAYTFAMTGAKSMVPHLDRYARSTSPNSRFGFYCNWALNKLDGRAMPQVDPFLRRDTDWFLNPID